MGNKIDARDEEIARLRKALEQISLVAHRHEQHYLAENNNHAYLQTIEWGQIAAMADNAAAPDGGDTHDEAAAKALEE